MYLCYTGHLEFSHSGFFNNKIKERAACFDYLFFQISALYFVERRKFFAQDHTNTMKDMIMLKTMKDMDMTTEIMITKTMKDMTTNTIMIMTTIMITTTTNMITKDIIMIMAMMVIITQDITTKLVRISVFLLL